jgi:hypothetical protein
MIVSKTISMSIALFLYGFLFSYFFTPLHYGGDAVYYTNAYNAVDRVDDIFLAYVVYIKEIYSYEYIHFLMVWIATSLGLSKLLFFSLLNGFLYFISFRLARIYGASIFLAFFLIVTNYYLLAFFFTLEKLKVAVIFLFLGLFYLKKKNKYFGLLFIFTSVLSHFQVIIYYLSHVFSLIFKKDFYNLRSIRLIVVILALVSFFVFYFQGYIAAKLNWYIALGASNILFNFSKVFIFGLLVFFLSGMKGTVAAFYIFLSLIASIIGSDRIFMFAFFYFIFVALNAGKKGIFALYVSILFMLYKSFQYLFMIFQSGG